MSRRTERLDRLLYRKYASGWDNELFRAAVLQYAGPGARVLDVGAGVGIVEQMQFKRRVARVCGVDPDEAVLENPHLDEAHVGCAEQIPYADAEFDLALANNLLEHLESPDLAFREIARVLKPGGLFILKTPNRWHYVPLIALWTPHWFHERVNEWRGRKAANTFPTRYLVNTPRAVEKHAALAGFVVRSFTLIEGRPEYLRMSVPTYLVGWVYERLVNLVPGMARFRILMISVLQKAACATEREAPRAQAA
jgi:SAM-dependent methyltransferase